MSTPTSKIRVMVVEGDPVVRQGMARLLGHHPMIEIVASALSGRTAQPKLDSYRPDCVVLNLATAGEDAVALLTQLRTAPGEPKGIAIASPDLAQDVVAQVEALPGCTVLRSSAVVASEPAVATLVQQLLPQVLRQGRSPVRANPVGTAPPHLPSPPPAPPVHGPASLPPAGPEVPAPAAAAPRAAARPVPATPSPTPAFAVPAAASLAPAVPAAVPGSVAPGTTAATAAPLRPVQAMRLPAPPRALKVVGIGVSTGGPKALAELLPRLPADFPLPVVLVQHMPPKFTASLAESLDRACRLRVSEARDGDRLERGRVLIAPGGLHMRVVAGEAGEVVRLTEDPPECSCRPSVDYLFRSLAEVFGARALGVVLTGMGEDGWIGSRLIHGCGGRVLAQHEASCTVYGMPRGPIESGIATAVALEQMADAIVQLTRGAPCN